MLAIPTAKVVNINDIVGHSGTGTAVSQALITAEVHDLMDRISTNKPGIRGSRFPRGWNRPETFALAARLPAQNFRGADVLAANLPPAHKISQARDEMGGESERSLGGTLVVRDFCATF